MVVSILKYSFIVAGLTYTATKAANMQSVYQYAVERLSFYILTAEKLEKYKLK